MVYNGKDVQVYTGGAPVSGANPLPVTGSVTVVGTLVAEEYDHIAATYPSATQEVYTYKAGGSGGTTVAIITVNYTDSTKASLLNVART